MSGMGDGQVDAPSLHSGGALRTVRVFPDGLGFVANRQCLRDIVEAGHLAGHHQMCERRLDSRQERRGNRPIGSDLEADNRGFLSHVIAAVHQLNRGGAIPEPNEPRLLPSACAPETFRDG